jgi:putative hydrolase of the HAD superfamily
VIRGVALDLDDTLYLEGAYVRSGFMAVARTVATTPSQRETLEQWLSAAFESGVRGDTFDRLRARFPDVAARWSTAQLVELYRTHEPELVLARDVADALTALLASGVRLGIVTDGPAASQAAKARALGVHRWCDPIVLTDSLGAGFGKPHPAGFELVAAAWGFGPRELAYVGDNPRKDFSGPRRLGWHTVRLRCHGQLHAQEEPVTQDAAADIEVGALAEVAGALGLGR